MAFIRMMPLSLAWWRGSGTLYLLGGGFPWEGVSVLLAEPQPDENVF